MAITLEEFLVSVKYGIDEPSLAKFFDSLKRASTSIAGIAGQIVGLGIAVLKLADEMSEAGSKLYWMGQRLNETVTNIEAMSFALKEVGLSGEHATTALKQITNWTSSHGPAATMYLRSLGITATTAMGQIEQLGKRLMESGPRGSIQYAIELARMRSTFGLDEDTLRGVATPEYQAAKHHEGIIKSLVWGSDGEKGPDKFAAQSVKIQTEFGKMGAVFHNLTQRFGLGLFNKIQPELERLNRQLLEALPQIKAFLDQIINGAPALLHFLEGAIKGFGWLLETGTMMIKTWRELPEVMKYAVEAFLLLPKALDLLKSPLFWVIGGMMALMLLMDDYAHWKKDQETGSKVQHSYFNWGKADEMFKGFEDNKALKAIMDFYGYLKKSFEEATGLKGVFDAIAVVLGAIVLRYGIPMMLRLAGRGLAAGAGAAVAGAGGAAGVMSFLGPIGALAAATILGTELAKGLHEYLKSIGWAKDMVTDPKTGKIEIQRPDYDPVDNVGKLFKYLYNWAEKNLPTLKYQEEGAPTEELAPPDPARKMRNPAEKWQRHGSLMRGGVQVAGARQGDGWAAVLIKEGMDDAHEDGGRLYDLLKQNLEAVVKHLSDILDHLMAMSRQSGATGPGGMGGGGGLSEADAGYSGDVSGLGLTPEQYNTFRNTLASRESGGRYGAQNKYGYKGKYQFGPAEIRETAQQLGETPPSAQQFLSDPAMQERYMAQYTLMHHRYMMRDPMYRALSPIEQAGVLGAAHLSGPAGALAQLHGRNWRADANGTTGPMYRRMIENALRHAPLAPATRPRADAGGAARSFAVNNSTSISVTAPNPGSAAMQVADQMPRVFEHHIRFAKGALLA